MWKGFASIILALHVVCSLFVLTMPLIIPLGVWQGWPWVRDPWLRHIHLGIVLFIAAEVILGKPCPLMTWENRCRIRAGMPLYTTGFFDYWVEKLLKIPFKDWMFESIFFLVGASTVAEYFLLGPVH
ncbi:MAG: DUF2784 domain-containing protein [Pseudobdellovibrionaceae bacterium]|nr:DUF2784 domain-containing protein [Pseudobdellovibrionaceae bacterium]